MNWLNTLLCAIWPGACPPSPRPDTERDQKRAVLDAAVARHHLDDDRDERWREALDVEIAVQARRERERRRAAP